MQFAPYTSASIGSPKFFYYIGSIHECLQKKALLDWFTIRDRRVLVPEGVDASTPIIQVTGSSSEMKKLQQEYAVLIPNQPGNYTHMEQVQSTSAFSVYGVMKDPDEPNVVILCKLSDNANEPPFRMWEQFYIESGMIANYTGPKMKTDVGKFLLNQLLLVYPFGDLIPYINRRFDAKELDGKVASLILTKKATRAMYDRYMTAGFWFGSAGTLSITSWTERSLTTDPKIAQRRKELFEQYADKMDDPSVIVSIEKELMNMDKEYIRGDPSEAFYFANEKSSFQDQRKKMFISIGIMPAFSKNATGVEFVSNSLEEGWRVKDLTACSNEIRRGSYGRSKKTAEGGTQTKFILRIFQETHTVEDDCGTKRGLPVLFTKKNWVEYLDRWLVNGTLITRENGESLIGKTLEVRSPMYCKSHGGYCNRCLGELFKQLDMKNFGVNALMIGANMMQSSMDSMHVSTISATKITDLKKFLVDPSGIKWPPPVQG